MNRSWVNKQDVSDGSRGWARKGVLAGSVGEQGIGRGPIELELAPFESACALADGTQGREEM